MQRRHPVSLRPRPVRESTVVHGRACRAAVLLQQRQRLLSARPLFVHLRGRFDEVALDTGPGLRIEVGSGEHAVHDVAEFVHERLELIPDDTRALVFGAGSLAALALANVCDAAGTAV